MDDKFRKLSFVALTRKLSHFVLGSYRFARKLPLRSEDGHAAWVLVLLGRDGINIGETMIYKSLKCRVVEIVGIFV